jgi:CMP-N,N'-diacetyllegionaminic acid synthase
MQKILAIIPARGASKGIPRKNLIPLCGKPLIQYTIDAAKGSKYINRIVLSSDDDEIIEYCKQQEIEVPFKRPKALSQDDTPMIYVVKDLIETLKKNEEYMPDFIILLQPTSPLRTSKHIDGALESFINSGADSIVSVVEVPHQFNPYSVMKLEDDFLKPFLPFDERDNLRQLKPRFYARNGAAIYAFTYQCLVYKNSLYGNKILPYYMGKEESIDIDDMIDVLLAECLLKRR